MKTYTPQLERRFGLKDFQAAGIWGNIGHESLGTTELREVGQPPGRGGYGWLQWTGPRARAYLNWCGAHKLDWRSDAANFGYLVEELSHEYAYVITHLKETTSMAQAVEVFEQLDERAGVVAMGSRINWGQIAMHALDTPPGVGIAAIPEAGGVMGTIGSTTPLRLDDLLPRLDLL